jgi:RimJ/RimL family protein N-acetyltransferase
MNNNNQDKFFSTFPKLETERFILKEFTHIYLPNLIKVMSDKETMKYSGMIIIDVEKQAKLFVRKVKEMYEAKKGIRWAIIDKNAGQYIGDIGFYNIDFYSNRTELGYIIFKKFWRQGIATECINRLTKFAFEEFGMHKIILMIDNRNIKSFNLANKLGFKHDGILREEYYNRYDNEYVSMNIFSKLKSEYR